MSEQIRLTREELYQKVWEKPTGKIAAEFGISDVALAKICRKMDVPKPPLGYWRKVETGSQATKPSLPEASKTTTKFIYINIPAAYGSDLVDREIQTKIDREYLPENRIKIADSFDDAHPLVLKTKNYFGAKANGLGDIVSPPTGQGLLSVSAAPEQRSRALLIFDAIIKGCQERGYEVAVTADRRGEEATRIIKEDEELQISLYENLRKIRRELTPEEKKKPPYLLIIPDEYEAGGKLTLKINYRWSNYQKWSDRQKEPLENRLSEVMAGIVAILESLIKEKRRKVEEERLRQESFRRKEEEKQRRENLEADAREWGRSEKLTAYLDAYEARLLQEKGSVSKESPQAEWLKWARRYAASINPLNRIFKKEKENE